MLRRNDVVLILRIQWLVLRRHIDFVIRQFVLAEVLEEIRISSAIEVYV